MRRFRVIWDNLTRVVKMPLEAPKTLQRLLIKSNMISRILGHSGHLKVVPLTTKYSQAKISDSTKHHLDLTTTRSSMDKV